MMSILSTAQTHLIPSHTCMCTGLLTLNGQRVPHNSPGNHISYVPQDNDTLIGVLSTKQLLSYSAELKTGLRGEALEKRVAETIARLGLENHADTQIGTIYKRVRCAGGVFCVRGACHSLGDGLKRVSLAASSGESWWVSISSRIPGKKLGAVSSPAAG
jgi:hypothetical protein